jgi:hypothetical protein
MPEKRILHSFSTSFFPLSFIFCFYVFLVYFSMSAWHNVTVRYMLCSRDYQSTRSSRIPKSRNYRIKSEHDWKPDGDVAFSTDRQGPCSRQQQD